MVKNIYSEFLNIFCSIDASANERLGKFVNDSPRRYANCTAKAMLIDQQPHVLLFACKDIPAGSELRYDYGGGNLTWRKVCQSHVSKQFC